MLIPDTRIWALVWSPDGRWELQLPTCSGGGTDLKLCYIKVKWSRYRPGVAQSVGRGIAVLFHDRGTRRGWVVSSTPRPHFTPAKEPVPILQEAGWAPGPVWTGGKSRPHRDSIPDRSARSSVTIPTELRYGIWYILNFIDTTKIINTVHKTKSY